MQMAARKVWLTLTLLPLLLGWSSTATGAPPKKNKFHEAVPKIEASFDPPVAKRGETVTWKLTVELAPGWHTYPTRQVDQNAKGNTTDLDFPEPGDVVFVGGLDEPPFKTKQEPLADILQLRYYEQSQIVWKHAAVVNPKAEPGKKIIRVALKKFLVCDARTCLPAESLVLEAPLTISSDPPVPVEDKYKSEVPAAGGGTPAPSPPDRKGSDDKSGQTPKPAEPSPSTDGTVQSVTSASQRDMGLLVFILQGVFFGAISLITPCVFPMIPITVSFFLKQSEKEHHRPIVLALVYTLTIVAVLTIGAILLLTFFQAAIQHWATNAALGGLFIFFALSLLGMYEITLPSGLANFTSAQQGRGGLIGTVFMALTFSIISFSCVAPFMGGFAALVPSFGDVRALIGSGEFAHLAQLLVKLLLGALAFSLTFAAPFFLLALFPSLLRTLPKSGAWMNTVKVVMGFVEVAAALKFFRAGELLFLGEAYLFTYDLALGMYVALSLGCGLYLLNLYRLPHDEPPEHLGVMRLLFSLFFLSLALYLMPGLFKDKGEKQRPTGIVFAWLDSFLLPDDTDKWIGSLKEGLKEAKDKRRLVFVDFTGLS